MTDVDFEELLSRGQELRAQGVRGRYAPSPTGSLHLGNLRTALVAWLQTRLADGTFIMRMEDLDEPRVVPGSAEEILEDLRWLGLDWDEGPDVGGPVGPYDQRPRAALYEEALRIFDAKGLVFRCYCSRKDVREAASAPDGPGGVIYPGTCRFLTPEEQEAVQAEQPDRPPSYRFVAPDREIVVVDAMAGTYAENLAHEVGDFVIRRADDVFAYQLAVVVDDALMGMSDVVRGADLLSSSPRQVALFETLGVEPPRFWHAPMMFDEEGRHLAKRHESTSLRVFQERGWDAARVVGHLAAGLGWVDQGARLSAQELLQELDLDDLR